MLFSLLSWNRPADQENGENRNPNSGNKERKPGLSSVVLDQLSQGTDITKGRLKHRDAAILVMRVLLRADSRLSLDWESDFNAVEYLSFLDRIEAADFSPTSFGEKHVLAVEGLTGCGKNLIATFLTKTNPTSVVIHRRKTPSVIARHSPAAEIAWQFLETYRMALEVAESSSAVFILDDYYHCFLATSIASKTSSDSQVSSLSTQVFAWPYDLPMPELVLFLTTDSDVRRQRQHSAERLPGGSGFEHAHSAAQDMGSADFGPKDARAQVVYSLVRGPGTVGIDTTPAALSVCQTVLEALDYFGFYSLSRSVASTASATSSLLAVAAVGSEPSPDQNEYSDNAHSPQRAGFASALGSPQPQQSHDALYADMDDYLDAFDFDDNPQHPNHHHHHQGGAAALSRMSLVMSETPVLSPEEISSRRVSVGIYGMYSRF